MNILRIALLSLVCPLIGAACAQGVQEGDQAAGPTGTVSSSASGQGGAGGAMAGPGGAGGGVAGGGGTVTGGGGGPSCDMENQPCDDGKFCTDNDTCTNGVCSGSSKFCPSPDSCHIGVCDEATKSCKAMPGNDGAQCDDKDPCTQQGKCQGGMCTKGSPVDCSFFNTPCSTGFCDPMTGCTFMAINEGGFCDDGMGGQCSAGSCQAGMCVSHPLNQGDPCDDMMFNPCTTGVCDVNGKCNSVPQPQGTQCFNFFGACDDSLCDGTGICGPVPKNEGADCDDGMFNPCTQGKCMAGNCVSHAIPNGGACNDGHFCTVNDTCQAGFCLGTINNCVPPQGDPCHTAICNDQFGICQLAPGNDGAMCDDQNLCSSGETCSNGDCQGGAPANAGAPCTDADGCTGGTTCVAGTTLCGNPDPMQQITTCTNGDQCCPAGCTINNDSDCLFWASGVLQNVAPATLTGWQACYTDNYAVAMDQVINQIVNQNCTKGKLLLACRKIGAPQYQLVAMGLRADVLFDCGTSVSCTHQANGVGWYYNSMWSWGFANAGDPVSRNECDTDQGPLRLCWHTVSGAGGYRCGDVTGLNGDPTWERTVMQAD